MAASPKQLRYINNTGEMDAPKTFTDAISFTEAMHGEAVVNLILKLRPNWQKTEVEMKLLSGGPPTNRLLMLGHHAADLDLKDAIVVRLSQGETEEQQYAQENEFMVMQMAQQSGIYTQVLGSFANGVIYSFAPGRVLEICKPEFFQPDYIRSICRTVAKFHLIDPTGCDLVDSQGDPTIFRRGYTVYNRITSLLLDAPDSTQLNCDKEKATGVSAYELLEELSELDASLSALGLTKCLTHNDLRAPNMLYNKSTDSITLIDYEYASYGYAGCDFFGLYDGYIFFRQFGQVPKEAPTLTPDLIRRWQRTYLEEKFKLQGLRVGDVDSQLPAFSIECEMCSIMTILIWLCEMYAPLDVKKASSENWLNGKIKGINVIYDYYMSRKEQLPSLIKKYTQLMMRM